MESTLRGKICATFGKTGTTLNVFEKNFEYDNDKQDVKDKKVGRDLRKMYRKGNTINYSTPYLTLQYQKLTQSVQTLLTKKGDIIM